MAENASLTDGVPTLQLVSGAGDFNTDGLAKFARDVGLLDKGLDYATVAIMGPQSSGKSTLLNSLFGTKFRMMDFLKGRGQTTQGIWLAPANVQLETFTLVLDLEGTDGRERGEDDTAFEKQSTLFALAVADVIIVNMWCHDIGREHAANKPLLKTVFQVMMRLFLPRKATLLFVIRDKTRTPIETLEPILKEDLEKIWSSVPKPEEHRSTAITDFFTIEVTWLPNFEEKEEEFKERTLALRERFQRSIGVGGIAADRRNVVPAQGLLLSMENIWATIRHNKDLDLPAHKVMVATVRCEQIAQEKLSLLAGNEAWSVLKEAVGTGTGDVSGFGVKTNELVAACIAGYEQETSYFEERVRTAKKEQLVVQIKEVVLPVHTAAVSNVSSEHLKSLKDSLVKATGGEDGSAANFAASCRECTAEALSRFDQAMGGLELPVLRLELKLERKSFSDAVSKFTEELRAAKLKDAENYSAEFLGAVLVGPVASILESGKPDAWDRIRALWGTELTKAKVELTEALEGFELTEEEQGRVLGAVEGAGRKAVEDKTRELARNALALMKEKFTAVFMHDAQGMPRRWTANVDVPRLTHDARLASLQVLATVAAVQLDAAPATPTPGAVSGAAPQESNPEHKPKAGTGRNPILVKLLPLLDARPEEEGSVALGASGPVDEEADSLRSGPSVSLRKGTLSSKGSKICLWENIPASSTFLSPEDCRSLWKHFKKETLYLVSQALQAQEAQDGRSWLPPMWAIVAMIVLGYNEMMALIRNPLLLLLLAVFYLFGRAIWNQLSDEDVFRHGMVPGLLAISSKIVPAFLKVIQHLVEAGQTQLNALADAQRPRSQYAIAGGPLSAGFPPKKLPPEVEMSSVYTNGLPNGAGAAESSVASSPLPHGLRQRPAAAPGARHSEIDAAED